jgi:transcriptional regulator with XRE-family HTH domain
MRERIIQFLEHQGISPARFADEIGVQRSSISHIVSGRNNPSFEFIQKILTKYKSLNAEWLMRGVGSMFNNETIKTNIENENPKPIQHSIIGNNLFTNVNDNNDKEIEPLKSLVNKLKTNKSIEKVIVFFDDKTFSSYTPENL